MKTMILLMVSFIFITGSLFGQKDKFEYIDSDVKGEILKIKPYNPYLKKTDHNSLPIFYGPIYFKSERSKLYHDSALIKIDTVNHYSDFAVTEKFPGASRFYAKIPNLSSSPYEKSFILSPDTTRKHYLIIIDPVLHTITK